MSEPIFPAPGGNGAAAPAMADPQPEKKSNRKALLAVGGIVAAAALGAGAFFMLTSSGSGDDEFAGPTTKARPQASSPAKVQASAPAKTTKVTIKTAVVTGRDPFAVLFPVVEKPATTTGGTSGGPSASATPPSQTQTTTHSIAVVTINGKSGTADLKIDGKAYSAAIGEKFATYYTLYAVFNAQCVGVLFGDQAVASCIGNPVTVTQ